MISTRRLEALADGVFAIVMTLLVLELRIPEGPGHMLMHALRELAPNFLAYGLAFILLGTAWVSHHGQFHHIKQTDRNGLWLNILFLMSVSLVPFVTMAIAHYPLNALAVTIFGSLMVWNSLMLVLIWRHAQMKRFAVCPEHVCRLIEAHASIALAIYLIGVIASTMMYPHIALWIYAIVPLIYLIPWKVTHG